jgi:hypothetical protein
VDAAGTRAHTVQQACVAPFVRSPLTTTIRRIHKPTNRQLLLKSVNVGVIASIFTWGAVDRPKNLGVTDYGGGVKLLGLCPPTPNCISTSEDIEGTHYAPPLCVVWWCFVRLCCLSLLSGSFCLLVSGASLFFL